MCGNAHWRLGEHASQMHIDMQGVIYTCYAQGWVRRSMQDKRSDIQTGDNLIG